MARTAAAAEDPFADIPVAGAAAATPTGAGTDPFAGISVAGAPTGADPFADIPAPKAQPQGFMANVTEPFKRLPGIYFEAATQNIEQLEQGYKDIWAANTVVGRAWGALEMLGGAAGYALSPAQAAIQSFVGEPLEAETGVKGLGKRVGEWGSFATQLALDPVAAVGEVAKLARPGLLDPIERVISPTTREVSQKLFPGIAPKAPAEAGQVIARFNAAKALEAERFDADMQEFEGLVKRLSPAQQIDMQLVLNGEQPYNPLPGGLDATMQSLRKHLKLWEGRLQSLGLLQQTVKDYFPRLYRFKTPDRSLQDAYERSLAGTGARRLRGSRGAAGLRQRTLPTLREGLERGDLELVTTNPIEAARIRLLGMRKWYYDTMMMREFKNAPWTLYSMSPTTLPEGWRPLEDEAFRAKLPPVTTPEKVHDLTLQAAHFTSYDPALRAGLERVAKFLGTEIKTPGGWEDPVLGQLGAMGYTSPLKPAVAQFGTDTTVIMHEIGHKLDFAYGLKSYFKNNPAAWQELRKLGEMRIDPAVVSNMNPEDLAYFRGDIGPSGRDYGSENIANLFHAYWHAPKLLDSIAPNARTMLGTFLMQHPGLKQVIDSVEPSVRGTTERKLQTIERTVVDPAKYYPGVRYLGRWYAPEPVARVFNNYVSSAWAHDPSPWWSVLRRGGNILNSLQLGLSAFHFTMESLDTATSIASRVPSLIKAGEYGKAARSLALGTIGSVPIAGPAIVGARTAWQGYKFRQALLNPGAATPEFQALVQPFIEAGARMRMDPFYLASGSGGFMRAIKGGYLGPEVRQIFREAEGHGPVGKAVSGAATTALRAFETTMEPLMAYYVPALKRGVFVDLAGDWLRANPAATNSEMRAEMVRIWDTIENRLGQMTYDNLFWGRALKNMAHVFIRAVGWNLGTIRELGGGIYDAVKALHGGWTGTGLQDVTRRTEYTVLLPLIVGLQGSMLNYLYTGQGPQSLLDMFFPRTGRTTDRGDAERVNIPSYIKDLFAYNTAPGQTLMNKLHPLWSLESELYRNRDYYGGVIVDPATGDPTMQTLEFMLREIQPFSIQGIERQEAEGADPFPAIMSMLGFVPAPMSIVNPERERAYTERQTQRARRARLREQERLGY